MASIFHHKRSGEGPMLRSRFTASRRRVQGMGSYFFDILFHWRWYFVALLVGVSLIASFTHKSSREVSRGLITFQIGNAIQSGMLSATELQTLMGRTDNIRERQLNFLTSHEFYRMASGELLANGTHSKLREYLHDSQNSFLQKYFSSKLDDSEKKLIEQLRSHVVFLPNGDNNILIEVHAESGDISIALTRFISDFALKHIRSTQFENIMSNLDNVKFQMDELKGEIKLLNDEVVQFKNDHKMLSTQTLPEEMRNSITNLNKALLDAEIQLQENTFMLREFADRAEAANQRILATQGVGYHDQVLESKQQELVDQKAMLEAKITGLKKILAQESTRFRFVASGEEKIGQIKTKMNAKFEQLNQLEQKYGNIQGAANQLKNSVRALGDIYLVEIPSRLPLALKLVLVNLALLFVTSMGLFYWYELFPTLSYRDPSIAELEIETMPWLGQKFAWQKPEGALFEQAQRLCAQSVLRKLSGPGIHQVISAGRRDGKSMLTGMMARELAEQGHQVTIIDLSQNGQYGTLPSLVEVINDSNVIEGFLANPKSVSFAAGKSKWILVDSSALSEKIGHLLVSPSMDGIIFVGSYLQTRTECFSDWQLKIEQLAGKKAVFVLNKTDLRVDLPFLLMAPAVNNELKNNRKVS